MNVTISITSARFVTTINSIAEYTITQTAHQRIAVVLLRNAKEMEAVVTTWHRPVGVRSKLLD